MKRRAEGEPLNIFTRALISYNREHGRTPVTRSIGRDEAIEFDPANQAAIEFQRMHRIDDLRKRKRDRALKAALELP